MSKKGDVAFATFTLYSEGPNSWNTILGGDRLTSIWEDVWAIAVLVQLKDEEAINRTVSKFVPTEPASCRPLRVVSSI